MRHQSKKPSARLALGRSGEDLAAAWYLAHGYEVVGRNWRCRDGEVDIIARRGRLVVFCEVKARSSLRFGGPVEAVGPRKQAQVRRVASRWFMAQAEARQAGQAEAGSGHGRSCGAHAVAAAPGGPVRFDVASVLGGHLELYEGAF